MVCTLIFHFKSFLLMPGIQRDHRYFFGFCELHFQAPMILDLIDIAQWVVMPHNLIFLALHFTISKRR